MVKEILGHPFAVTSRVWKDDAGNVYPFGRLKEPALRLAHLHHYFHAFMDADKDGVADPFSTQDADKLDKRLVNFKGVPGQQPLLAPSVFNYYQPDHNPYEMDEHITAPAFQVATNSAVNAMHNQMYTLLLKQKLSVPKAERKKSWVYLDADKERYLDFLLKGNQAAFENGTVRSTSFVILDHQPVYIDYFSDQLIREFFGSVQAYPVLRDNLKAFLHNRAAELSALKSPASCPTNKQDASDADCKQATLISEALLFIYLSPDMAMQH